MAALPFSASLPVPTLRSMIFSSLIDDVDAGVAADAEVAEVAEAAELAEGVEASIVADAGAAGVGLSCATVIVAVNAPSANSAAASEFFSAMDSVLDMVGRREWNDGASGEHLGARPG